MLCFALGFTLLAQPRPFSMILGGDIMLNGISVKQRPLAKLTPLFKPAGVAIANLEIPLTNATEQTPNKSAEDVRNRNQFILKADPQHVWGLAATGLDLVSLGNNHCMDYRAAGMNQMRGLLAKFHIAYAGAGGNREEALSPVVFTSPSGVRVGMISALAFVGAGALGHCTPAGKSSAGIGTLFFGGKIDKAATDQLAGMIQSAKATCDILVIGLHWGIERQTLPSAYQVALGRACIDAGADIVWGNHPHVLQGAEVYKGKPILYSMGNLVSSKGGATGLVKLVYSGLRPSLAQFLPLAISGGRVGPVNGKPGQRAVKEYESLCKRIQKEYPNRESVALLPLGFTHAFARR